MTRRLLLVLIALSPLLLGQDFGSGIPMLSVQPAVVAGQLFTEDCAADPTPPWTDMSDDTATDGEWVAASGSCNANATANDWVSMVQTTTDNPDVFCSGLATEMDASAPRLGCVLRAASAGGDHLMAGWFNDANGYFMQNHDGDDSTNHLFVDQVDENTIDCGCTYTDLGAGAADYFGITLTGTGSSTAVSWWDFGTSAPSDLQDPSTWGTATCECDASDVAGASFTEIDGAGLCGPEARSTSGTDSLEANFDTFACGDIP